MIGTTIKNFRVDALIGDGGMGSVYRGWDTNLDRPVALKVIHPHLMRDPSLRERFRNEARIQGRLNHANIVSVYDFDAEAGAIVMEFVPGIGLDHVIEQAGAMLEARALAIFRQVVAAMAYAHEYRDDLVPAGIIHRDLKPANVLLINSSDAEIAKVTDFGIAKIFGDIDGRTATGATMGTMGYMSPEQVVSARNVTAASDIYSLGITLYEMITGRVPFDEISSYEMVNRIVRGQFPRPRDLNPQISARAEAIIERCMAREPGARFQDCRQLLVALDARSDSWPPGTYLGSQSMPPSASRTYAGPQSMPPVGPGTAPGFPSTAQPRSSQPPYAAPPPAAPSYPVQSFPPPPPRFASPPPQGYYQPHVENAPGTYRPGPHISAPGSAPAAASSPGKTTLVAGVILVMLVLVVGAIFVVKSQGARQAMASPAPAVSATPATVAATPAPISAPVASTPVAPVTAPPTSRPYVPPPDASPTTQPYNPSAPATGGRSVEDTFRRYARAETNRDGSAITGCFAPSVRFFNSVKTGEQVEAAKRREFEKSYDTWRVAISNEDIQYNQSGTGASVEYDADVYVQRPGKSPFFCDVRKRLLLHNYGGAWMIDCEEDIQIRSASNPDARPSNRCVLQ